MSVRRAILALGAVLALTGATLLVFLPPSVGGAEALEPVTADFTLAPGGRQSKTVTKPLINGGGTFTAPNDCRNNPAIGLTCATYRIKLQNRRPGVFLRITTSWTARDAVAASVPDVDTYLYPDADTPLAFETVGGAGSAMPETIKVVDPPQDEYDLVVAAFAGAIVDHTVTVEYTDAPSSPTPGVPADFTLTPKAAPISREFTTALAVPTITGQKPDTCRNDPTQEVVCDVYRFKLNRSRTPGAVNFVVVTLDWGPFVTPDLRAAIVGLGGEQVPNLDMYVFDSPATELEGVGANLFASPERAAFVAIQDEYDIVVQSKRGAATSYKLTAFMSDELFDKPFEFLDPVTGQPITSPVPVGGGGGFVSPVDGSFTPPPLALAPIDTDDQIAGIGLGTTEQFDAQNLLDLGRGSLRNTATTAEPPAAWVLWLAIVVAPAAAVAATVVVMRRRHAEAF